jgi:gluconate 5-dehydrogenase
MGNMFSLDGQVAFVTGSSRGLGAAMAAALAAAGARIVLNGRDRGALERTAAEFRAKGWAAEIAEADVTDEAAATRALDEVVARHGRLDVLIANAGVQYRHKLAEFPTAEWRHLLDTHLTSAFVLARRAAAPMLSQGRGRIIVTASVMGSRVARPTIPAYAAAKAGLVGLVKALAVELGPGGVTCNAIAPGYFATEMNTALVQDREFSAWVEKRTPVGRWGRVEEIGGAAVFLASDAASYVNGHVLFVDGGLTCAL